MANLRVAVSGVGSFGQHHARIAAASDRVDLVAVVDPDEARGRDIAERNGTAWAPDLDGLLGSVDAVQMAAPTALHHALGLSVLRAGKHLLMEKPLAATLPEGRDLLDALASARTIFPGLVAAVGHLERFNPAVQKLRQLGFRPRFAEAMRVSPFPKRSMDVDVVMDVMIHDLDLLRALMGQPVASVEAVGVPVLTPFADMVNARLKFEGGGFAMVTASRVARKKERTLRAFAENAYASLDLAAQKLEILHLAPGPDGPQVEPETVEITAGEPLKLELEAFYAACQGDGKDFVPWEEGLEAMQIANQVQQAVAASLKNMLG